MFPKVNPKQMQQAMRQMGIAQEGVDAIEVIIRTPDADIVISEPEVLKVKMAGTVTFQVAGTIREQPRHVQISDDDVRTVMNQAGVDEKQARSAIEAAKGDLAQAILSLQGS